MKINIIPQKNHQFHAYLLFYVIVSVQIGVGIFSFQRSAFKVTGHDAWISVIIAGICTHLTIWLIVRMLEKYESTDLYGIHYDIFGKYIGTILNCCYMFYYLFVTAMIIRNYIEVVQAWVFPDMPAWLMALIIASLTIFAGHGGIRTILGICMFSFFVILPSILLFYSSLEFAVWTHLLPIWDTNTQDILNGAITMGFSLAGFEVIFSIYPFIVNKERTMLHAQLGVAFTNVVYLCIMMISIVYFSPDQLKSSIWPSINMLKIVKYSYLERLEFIVISVWFLVILGGILFNTWFITRGFKRMWNLNSKITLIISLCVIVVFSLFIEGYKQIDKFNNWADKGSIIFSYLYPVLLSFIVAIVFKIRNVRNANKQKEE